MVEGTASVHGAPSDLVELGRITAAHGVHGWVKVQPYSADAQCLLAAQVWWLKAPDSALNPGVLSHPSTIKVRASRMQGKLLIAQLGAIDERDGAQALRGYTVWAPRSDFPAAQPGEYYWVDLLGCDFYGERAGLPAYLGRVDEVLDNGAHAILRIRCGTLDEHNEFVPLLNARGKPQDMLVPFVDAHVQGVDLLARRMDSNWPAEF
ncbi:ribosome maturation factor RimM [Alcaligenaceae bacterium CGII-47]|nr:ribosome maturation factor RimM [Alcaligenaceae bacterium CGII-47]